MTREQWQKAVDKCIELKSQGKGNWFTDGLAIKAEQWPATRNIVSGDTKIIELLEKTICV